MLDKKDFATVSCGRPPWWKHDIFLHGCFLPSCISDEPTLDPVPSVEKKVNCKKPKLVYNY
jgi:hypothetical protein